jgi:acyl-coenzyme A synthetase/AMP-(fatty) acid ligase
MDKVITSTHRIPDLPRCSVFDYLFPPKVKGAQPQWYQAVPPDTLAYIDGLTGRKVTRGEVEVQAKRVATGLKKLGMRRGQVVCVYGMNSLEWVNAAMGCLAGDFLISPANYG